MDYSHRVAVVGYIYEAGRFLLLKRRNPPKVWAPPGGRLLRDENPHEGLKREIYEETRLSVEVIAPLDTWFGHWNDEYWLLSIDYLVKVVGGALQLSGEHTASRWLTLEELEAGSPVRLSSEVGFTVADFHKAKRLYEALLK